MNIVCAYFCSTFTIYCWLFNANMVIKTIVRGVKINFRVRIFATKSVKFRHCASALIIKNTLTKDNKAAVLVAHNGRMEKVKWSSHRTIRHKEASQRVVRLFS